MQIFKLYRVMSLPKKCALDHKLLTHSAEIAVLAHSLVDFILGHTLQTAHRCIRIKPNTSN